MAPQGALSETEEQEIDVRPQGASAEDIPGATPSLGLYQELGPVIPKVATPVELVALWKLSQNESAAVSDRPKGLYADTKQGESSNGPAREYQASSAKRVRYQPAAL